MIPFAAVPWRLVGLGVAALVVVGALLWLGHRVRLSYRVEAAEAAQHKAEQNLASYQAAAEREARRAALERAADQKADQALAARVDSLTNENAQLHQLVARFASTVERTDAHGNRSPSVNPDWWLCHAAQAGRDPADIAACQARAGDAGVPDTERH